LHEGRGVPGTLVDELVARIGKAVAEAARGPQVRDNAAPGRVAEALTLVDMLVIMSPVALGREARVDRVRVEDRLLGGLGRRVGV
jgi:hypothetical protein